MRYVCTDVNNPFDVEIEADSHEHAARRMLDRWMRNFGETVEHEMTIDVMRGGDTQRFKVTSKMVVDAYRVRNV